MATNHQQRECDERLIRGYLDDTLSETEQQRVEQHLCECQSCCNAISDSAAEEKWWGDASAYLRVDPWDDETATAVFSTSIDLPERPGHSKHPLALRQIKDWLDPTDDPRMLGRFGGYEIVGIIGQGGMGVVLKGFEPSLNRYVAIKVLAPPLASSGAARKRFAREAKATAAILHDNVISIHRVDETNDLPYLVMPYLSDAPLQTRIDDEGPMPLVEILRIGEQIAAGLAAAHSHGLVHRDIKPANILLERGVERVRITDFGLARSADDGSLTRTGVIAGTPQYMSPEQARGESVDARSDLFSLGSVMYAMSTGRPPFRAETPFGILHRITDTEPRAIREINPDLPNWLVEIIAKLHAKRVEDRFASSEEVADLLQQCLAHVEQPLTFALPDLCRAEAKHRLSALKETQTSPTWHRFGNFALLVVVVAAAVGAIIAGRGLLSKGGRQSQTDVEPSHPTEANSRDQIYLDDDPAVAWDGTAEEISQLLQDARPFESRVEQLWDTLPMAPAAAPNSGSNTTSAQESKP
jgi:serine/threonine protein kinase